MEKYRLRKCPACGKLKEGVGPKGIGQGYSDDPRLTSPTDVRISKVMCNDCWTKLKEGKNG
jgi:hypothetical protein